jgi:2-hydroxychromene-2-carboxylate isomerase
VLDHPCALLAISDIMTSLWTGADWPLYPKADAAPAKAAGDARRTACGHYLGGTLHYGGECYWGIDRLHYLEARLTELGLKRGDHPAPLYPPPPDCADPAPVGASGKTVHFYCSFRSPYSWLAAERVVALAAAHGARLELRFVLPMVMRSLPVPPEKRRYTALDAAREARRLGIPFGKIADPVGRPVERGYSLLPWARSEGRGADFVIAFLRAVFSQGVDAGSDSGMQRIVEAAGLDWAAAKQSIGNDDWREEAEANRAELLGLGHWGVPSFRVDDFTVWGQDRLWMVDAALRTLRVASRCSQ